MISKSIFRLFLLLAVIGNFDFLLRVDANKYQFYYPCIVCKRALQIWQKTKFYSSTLKDQLPEDIVCPKVVANVPWYLSKVCIHYENGVCQAWDEYPQQLTLDDDNVLKAKGNITNPFQNIFSSFLSVETRLRSKTLSLQNPVNNPKIPKR